MKFSEIAFLLALSAAVVGLCLHGWVAEAHSATVLLPPAAIALAIVTLAAVRGWLTLRGGGGQATLQQRYWHELRAGAGGLLWCMAALPLLLGLGYPAGLALFAALYARAHGGSWPGSLLTGGFAFAVCWGLAGRVLGVSIELLPGWLA